MPDILKLVTRTIKFNKRPVLNQILIIALLTAVITGSLLTGGSVKESLKKSSSVRLGNTGILISSGLRYFDENLVRKMRDISGVSCTGMLETMGYSQNLNSQKGSFNTRIYGIENDFFAFNGFRTTVLNADEVAVNKRLADYLGIKTGDDIILKFTGISDIPADAPFAPGGDAGKSLVKKVGLILDSDFNGDFSLSITQIAPMNIFINLQDIQNENASSLKINRILIKKEKNNSEKSISEALRHNLNATDIGLHLRAVKTTGQYELTSDRIFIDQAILNEVGKQLPFSFPVITYLANRINKGSWSTPYSFVSALPSSLYPEISDGKGIIINRWMAQDISADTGDTVKMYWYAPDSLNKLVENSSDFVIKQIVDIKGIWSDSLLMPDFPGISGKESCSDWDAGVPIKMNIIRSKDDEYWKKFKGTPKAFINYEKGSELWGNNFGPATSIRFAQGVTSREIENKLSGSIDPFKAGFTVSDLAGESIDAANKSVDFGTLFLSLGFFLILSSLILLSFATSSYFDSKLNQIHTLFALGFKHGRITHILFLEAGILGLTGCMAGAFAGYFVDVFITGALNSVWNGAVQTDTLDAYFSIKPIVTGFILTFLTILVFMFIKIRRYLKRLSRREKEFRKPPSARQNLIFVIISATITISLFAQSFLDSDNQTVYSFASGTLLLFTLVLLCRQYYVRSLHSPSPRRKGTKRLSNRYYSFNPSGAVTPVFFIAAGIFTVYITGANRMTFNEKQLTNSGGTGGYLLWCENAIPVKADLNSLTGRKSEGLDEDQLAELKFVQMKKFSGNDASCLNLNHITAPPLLGIDPSDFIVRKSFSFSKVLKPERLADPWEYLNLPPVRNTIYGIADQTVLEWGLKLKTGDTLILRAENGQPLNIILAAGLQSSVFQGNVLIGRGNFTKYFPSVSGSSVMLVDGNHSLSDLYKNTLVDRLENYGAVIEKSTDRLASFYKVTNTYLTVFGFFGALGMISGVAGLGFVLLRNYNQRKKEFALMMATGFHVKNIRRMIFSEQVFVLLAGVFTGVASAVVATLPSIKNNNQIPWLFMGLMILGIVITGVSALAISVRSVTYNSLVTSLRKE
jgi:putative ABC transport system permease protein